MSTDDIVRGALDRKAADLSLCECGAKAQCELRVSTKGKRPDTTGWFPSCHKCRWQTLAAAARYNGRMESRAVSR